MRIAIFLASALTVCGFYVYVLAQLYREEKQLNVRKKSFEKHWFDMEPEALSAPFERIATAENSRITFTKGGTRVNCNRPRFYSTGATQSEKNAEAKAHREAVISLVLGIGGLTALFAGIELFNSLVIWPH